jgi:NADH-quinone oxidoreductase subunit J
VTAVLASGLATDAITRTSTGEAVTFWVLGALALIGAVGMVMAANAVYSAMFLAMTMIILAVFYMVQDALFLGVVQVVVYTGAVMMLFLFVLMLVGRDSSDSVVEVIRGQRLAGAVVGLAFVVLLLGSLAGALDTVGAVGLGPVNAAPGGNVGGLGRLVFTRYLFPFELTSALLITAALGAMLLAYSQGRGPAKRGQRATVEARLRGEHARVSPLPGPGVFATANSVATPALLPDGSIAPESLSEIIESAPAVEPPERRAPDAHALTAPHPDHPELESSR